MQRSAGWSRATMITGLKLNASSACMEGKRADSIVEERATACLHLKCAAR